LIFVPLNGFAFSYATPMKTISPRTFVFSRKSLAIQVLPLFVLKLINRNLLPFRLYLYPIAELFRHLTQHHR
jgi:hypothetical protein